jgi:hypothetical protein
MTVHTRRSDNREIDRLRFDDYDGKSGDSAHCRLTRHLASWRKEERRAFPGLGPSAPIGNGPDAGPDQPRNSYIILLLLGAFLGGLAVLVLALTVGVPW